MPARVWGKMIWLYRGFSQKLAEFRVGIVPCQGWSAAEAFKQPVFRLVFIQAIVFVCLEPFITNSENVD